MVGKSIHVFHRNPANIDRIMGAMHPGGAHELPHKATIELGPVTLDLEVEPMTDGHGEYVGAVVVWGVSAQQTIDALKAVQEVQRNDIEHLDGNLQMVATATHEIESSIAEIAKNAVVVSQAAEKSRTASTESKTAIERLRVWPRWRSSLPPSPLRPACWRSTPTLRRPGRECMARASRWWPAK
jgi:methyl-accepting chemotaxis protein